MMDLLDRWSDPLFGDLTWRAADQVWIGEARFGRRLVRVSLDPDRTSRTAAEQVEFIAPARRLYDGLPAVERELRRQAAAQIAEAIAEQDEDAELPREAFADALELEAVCLHARGGALHYRSPEFFPGQRITIFFDEVLAFGDAAVYD